MRAKTKCVLRQIYSINNKSKLLYYMVGGLELNYKCVDLYLYYIMLKSNVQNYSRTIPVDNDMR